MPSRYSQQDAHEFYLFALSGLAGPQAMLQEPEQAERPAAAEGPAAIRILPPAELVPMLPMLAGVPLVQLVPHSTCAQGCCATLLNVHYYSAAPCSVCGRRTVHLGEEYVE